MITLVEVILTIMAIAGCGICLFAIGRLIYFLIWFIKGLFNERSIIGGIFLILCSIFIICLIALAVISNIEKVWGY